MPIVMKGKERMKGKEAPAVSEDLQDKNLNFYSVMII